MNLAELIADLYTNLLFVIKKIAIKNRISSSQLLCIYASNGDLNEKNHDRKTGFT